MVHLKQNVLRYSPRLGTNAAVSLAARRSIFVRMPDKSYGVIKARLWRIQTDSYGWASTGMNIRE
jgi:hypothetical protein